jgi:hypothetical protein
VSPRKRLAAPKALRAARHPVTERNALEGLAPSLRREVLALAGGDLSRITVVGPGHAVVVPVERVKG